MADFTDEELEEIKRRLRYENPGSKYLDDFGQEISEIQALERYILAHKKELQEEFRAQKQAQDLAQENESTILEGFNELVAKDEWTSSPQEKEQAIREFLERKDKYFATISEEQRERINKEIEARLNNQHQEEQYYGNEVYTTSEDFKKRFKAMEAKRQQNSQFKGGKTQEASEIKVYTLANIERYLSLQEEYLARTDDTKNADGKTAFELIHENGQKDLQAFVDGKLVIDSAAYEKMDEFIKVFAGDYKNAEMQALEKAAREKLAQLKQAQDLLQENEATILEGFNELVAKDEWTSSPQEKEQAIREFLERKDKYFATISEEQKERINKEIEARLNNQHQEEQYYGNEVYTTSEDFKKRFKAIEAERRQNTEATQTLDSRRDERVEESKERQTSLEEKQKSRTEENVEDAIVVDEKETKEQALEKEEQDIYRDRSADSDSNEFMLDKLKLQVLLEMGVINQAIYDEGIKSPSAAIEKLQEKRPLKEKEQAEFENVMTTRMLEDNQLFNLLPPSILAQKYLDTYRQMDETLSHSPETNASAEQQTINKIEARIDELTEDLYYRRELFFADITNISDTYDGYMQMFSAREKYMGDSAKDREHREMIVKNREALKNWIDEYDRSWNLENIAEKDDKQLEARFDRALGALQDIVPAENVMQLVSNFKFLDAEGHAEPQFIDKEGKESDVWTPESQIIKGSKLENFMRIARQNAAMRQIGSNEELTPELLKEALGEEIENVLYSAHVANRTEQGIKENPNQFTDKKYLKQFIADLSNIEKPMSISPTAYDAAIDSQINSVGAFAHRLGSKVGKDKPIAMKMFEPLKDLDKRAADRTEKVVDKRKIRIEMVKRTVKGAASAFLVSGAITVAATAVAADAQLTASTYGVNKIAGMALGSALAITTTAIQIRRWRKERKAAGKKRGLGSLIKDRRMMMTIGTTALGAAAVGFAATGNPALAQACGYGSLALGSANGIINNVQDAKKNGLSSKEAIGWAVLQTATTLGAGFAGRWAANAGIDLYNKHNPENNIFQHETKIGSHQETITSTEIETAYKPGVVDNAQKILDYWYNDNPDLLQQRIDAIEAYNAEHGTNVNPQRYLLAAHDAGALSSDNNLLHVQDGPDIHSHANHKVLGEGWSQATGISQETVNSLASSVGSDGVNITAESIKAFQEIDGHISANNQVGHVSGNPHHNDGVLGFNAELDASGQAIASENGSQYTTYANHDGAFEQNIKETTITKTFDDYGMVRNETSLGVGMFGVLGNFIKPVQKLKDRAGALADRLFGKKKEPKPQPAPIPEEKKLPVHEEQKQLPAHKQSRALLPEHTEIGINEMLDKEYEIVHGIKPDEKERLRYKGLVQKEWQVEGTSDNFGRYLQERMNTFEDVLRTRVSVHDVSKGFADTEKGKSHISQTRETMWKTNPSVDGEVLESKDVTLRHFTHLTSLGKNSEDNQKITAARDDQRAPAPKGKADKPHGEMYNISKTVLKAINNRDKSK